MIGFCAEAPAEDKAPTPYAEMAGLALNGSAISARRVVAYYAARHMLEETIKDGEPHPEDVLTLAGWLAGAKDADEDDEPDEDDEDEAEGFAETEMRDGWPPVVVAALAALLAVIVSVGATLLMTGVLH